eukprot:gb/GECH01000560.1/.p1 GENE.gb/GECH01000560.1/~~gb/GECH01000560.1/.p1  ORF type:complete len:1118 (+),score=237.68 gb/GECH01000560.1/:1-3354(+)
MVSKDDIIKEYENKDFKSRNLYLRNFVKENDSSLVEKLSQELFSSSNVHEKKLGFQIASIIRSKKIIIDALHLSEIPSICQAAPSYAIPLLDDQELTNIVYQVVPKTRRSLLKCVAKSSSRLHVQTLCDQLYDQVRNDFGYAEAFLLLRRCSSSKIEKHMKDHPPFDLNIAQHLVPRAPEFFGNLIRDEIQKAQKISAGFHTSRIDRLFATLGAHDPKRALSIVQETELSSIPHYLCTTKTFRKAKKEMKTLLTSDFIDKTNSMVSKGICQLLSEGFKYLDTDDQMDILLYFWEKKLVDSIEEILDQLQRKDMYRLMQKLYDQAEDKTMFQDEINLIKLCSPELRTKLVQEALEKRKKKRGNLNFIQNTDLLQLDQYESVKKQVEEYTRSATTDDRAAAYHILIESAMGSFNADNVKQVFQMLKSKNIANDQLDVKARVLHAIIRKLRSGCCYNNDALEIFFEIAESICNAQDQPLVGLLWRIAFLIKRHAVTRPEFNSFVEKYIDLLVKTENFAPSSSGHKEIASISLDAITRHLSLFDNSCEKLVSFLTYIEMPEKEFLKDQRVKDILYFILGHSFPYFTQQTVIKIIQRCEDGASMLKQYYQVNFELMVLNEGATFIFGLRGQDQFLKFLEDQKDNDEFQLLSLRGPSQYAGRLSRVVRQECFQLLKKELEKESAKIKIKVLSLMSKFCGDDIRELSDIAQQYFDHENQELAQKAIHVWSKQNLSGTAFQTLVDNCNAHNVSSTSKQLSRILQHVDPKEPREYLKHALKTQSLSKVGVTAHKEFLHMLKFHRTQETFDYLKTWISAPRVHPDLRLAAVRAISLFVGFNSEAITILEQAAQDNHLAQVIVELKKDRFPAVYRGQIAKIKLQVLDCSDANLLLNAATHLFVDGAEEAVCDKVRDMLLEFTPRVSAPVRLFLAQHLFEAVLSKPELHTRILDIVKALLEKSRTIDRPHDPESETDIPARRRVEMLVLSVGQRSPTQHKILKPTQLVFKLAKLVMSYDDTFCFWAFRLMVAYSKKMPLDDAMECLCYVPTVIPNLPPLIALQEGFIHCADDKLITAVKKCDDSEGMQALAFKLLDDNYRRTQYHKKLLAEFRQSKYLSVRTRAMTTSM